MGNLATNLQDTVGQYPLHPAVWSNGELLSYGDLDDLSGRVAGGLRAHGIRAGERVALVHVPGTALPVLLYGVLRIGAVAVLLPEGLPPEQEDFRLRACGARMVFAAGRGKAEEENEPLRIAVGPGFLDQVAFWPLDAEIAYRGDGDPAVVHLDAGPAEPVVVVLDHGTLRARAYADATVAAGVAPGGVVYGRCPSEGSTGGLCGLHATVLAGACLVVVGATARPCPCSDRPR
ncbi:class I adenylate-forming enzyme family protein [Streptomyces sp. NPDC047974]|uniref:class I adenylate-forming enzyme family protein n=1 Tax=Streptomyces sp. NPDC047974 TaxID=3154343 RepID=UPI0033D090CF